MLIKYLTFVLFWVALMLVMGLWAEQQARGVM